MRKLFLPLGIVAALAGTGLCQKTDSSKGTPVREFKIVNLEYQGTKVWVPGTIIVKKGDAVKITLINNTPSGVHGFAIDEFGVKAEVNNEPKDNQKTVTFTADKAGLFRIYCHLHPGHIGGQLLVLE